MWKISRKYVLGAAFASVAALGVTEARAQGPWAGPYAGLHWGYGWANTSIVHDNGFVLTPPDNFNAQGWLAGAHLGLNVQLGPFVVGGELSLGGTTISGSRANCAPAFFGPNVDTCTKHDDWLLLAMWRFGFAQPTWMVYSTAGWAVAGVTTNDSLPVPITPNWLRASADHNGFAYGVGFEYRIPLVQCHGGGCGTSLTFGLEYLHVNLDVQTHTPTDRFARHVDQDLDILRARVSYKLDWCCGHHAPIK